MEDLTRILDLIAAAGALGTAAYGLVDASKAVCGGVSNAGFGDVSRHVHPLIGSAGAFGEADVMATLHANWLNGMAKADQKAAAKSLIRLCVTPENAVNLAKATGIDGTGLKDVAQLIKDGAALQDKQITLLGRFDAIVGAILDAAYERGDQRYRNTAKIAACGFAVALALAGGWVNYGDAFSDPKNFLTALLIGLISTPLAPIAKDLSSSLQAAVKAVGVLKR
jgi:hypothetical protein